jgi:hypothetical protein
LNLRPRTWVRREANKALLEAGETKPVTKSELDAALGNFCHLRDAHWITKQKTALDVEKLDKASREELDEAVGAVFADTMAVRRAERERQRRRDTEGPGWEDYPYAPDWWDLKVDGLFARLRPLQRQALALLAPPRKPGETLSVEDVPSELRVLADVGLPAGVDITLDVPNGHYDYSPLFTYQRMVFPGQLPLTARGRLARLEALALRVEQASGCRQWDALGFLLCDQVPWVSVVEVSLDKQVGSIAIRVRHPEVPVEVVAAVYKERREELGARQDRHHRVASGWPGAVDNFVTEWAARNNGRRHWPQIFPEFCARYPNAPYGSLESFRETCYRAEKWRRKADRERSAT